ncbi:TolC family protein [Haliangium sp.]|uniref:TolC family protein n=1 Tax=Haliangium sp. TaxID=2663208 RepID=UPI003D14B2D0
MPASNRPLLRALPALSLVFAAAAHADPAPAETPAALRLDLDALIARTLTGPRARMAHSDTEMARARAEEAEGARWPSLSATSFLAPSPDIRCDDASCTQTTPDDISLDLAGAYAGARFTAVQPLYTFGKLDAVSAAARAATQASEHLEDALAGDLAMEAARAYYGLKLARELVWLLEDGLAQVDKAARSLQAALDDGSAEVTVQDRLRVETLRAEVEARLGEAHEAEAVALAGVRALTGAPAADIDEEPLAELSGPLVDLEAALTAAREHRPELAAARAGVEAARAQARLESARWWPDLVVVGGVDVARAQGVDDPPSAFARDPFNTTSAALALALRWQLDPWRRRARVRGAQAQVRKAEALDALAADLARFEVQRAHAQAEAARTRLEAAQRGLSSARGWLAAVLQAEAVGALESKDFADAFIAYFTLQARHATSVYEWNLALVGLRRATGEFHAAPSVRSNR